MATIKTLTLTAVLAMAAYSLKAPAAVEPAVAPYQDLLALMPTPVYDMEERGDPYFVWTAEESKCMALNIFYEAGVEDFRGKLAVGTITLNRLATGRWGSDICSVVWAHKQFSWTLRVKRSDPTPRGQLWRESLEAAAEVLSGNVLPELDGSLHYHANYVSPRWARSKSEVAVIGTHIFYHN